MNRYLVKLAEDLDPLVVRKQLREYEDSLLGYGGYYDDEGEYHESEDGDRDQIRSINRYLISKGYRPGIPETKPGVDEAHEISSLQHKQYLLPNRPTGRILLSGLGGAVAGGLGGQLLAGPIAAGVGAVGGGILAHQYAEKKLYTPDKRSADKEYQTTAEHNLYDYLKSKYEKF